MHIISVPNRNSTPTILLRESYRENGKVKKRTLGNLTRLPADMIEQMKVVLKGGKAIAGLEGTFGIERSLPHGHVAAVLGVMKKLGLSDLLGKADSREKSLVLGMIAARVLAPRSKLAMARGMKEESARDTLSEELSLGDVSEDELYRAMDWLLARQEQIEARLAKKHLADGTLVLYDVTSSYLTGEKCELGKIGYSRDGKKGTLQIIYGLLCDKEGRPIAVEVFEGNTSDPKTLSCQLEKLKERFSLKKVVFVADRGLLTSARIEEEIKPVSGLEHLTALRTEQIRGLVESEAIQLSLFDTQDLFEIESDLYPGERLVACFNPLLKEKRRHNRATLLEATEKVLNKIVLATSRVRQPLCGKEQIGLRVGKVVERYKMAKHFKLQIEENSFSFQRDQENIDKELKLDGIYVIRTSVSSEALSSKEAVKAYKSLSRVERAFRVFKGHELEVRPIHHWLKDRVKAHIFLCMLSYYVHFHMREALVSVLFDDHQKNLAQTATKSPVSPAEPSKAAKRKASSKLTVDSWPVHSFKSLLDDLATLSRNSIAPKLDGFQSFKLLTQPTPFQQHVFNLLKVRL